MICKKEGILPHSLICMWSIKNQFVTSNEQLEFEVRNILTLTLAQNYEIHKYIFKYTIKSIYKKTTKF
jgi:hypothetical protein